MRKKEVFTDEERRRRNTVAVRKWREKNPERAAEYNKRYWKEQKEKVEARKEARQKARRRKHPLPSVDEVCALFKNPDAAAHFRWLAERRNKQV